MTSQRRCDFCDASLKSSKVQVGTLIVPRAQATTKVWGQWTWLDFCDAKCLGRFMAHVTAVHSEPTER